MSAGKRRAFTLLLIVLLLLTVSFIWGNSLLDRKASAEVSRGVLEFIKPLLEAFGLNTDDDLWLRKLAHFTEFGALGAELCMLFALHRPLRLRLISDCAAVSLAVAAADETIQLYSGRFASLKDALLDFAGALTGIVLLYWIIQNIKRRKSVE